MNHQYQTAGLNLPHLNKTDKLHRILNARVGSIDMNFNSQNLPYWNAAYFGLNQVNIFNESSLAEQIEIVEICNRNLLEEAYLIEKAGVGYMAKMVTLAETTEERMLYALFAADEAIHLSQISHYVPNPELVNTNNPFLQLLQEVLENQEKSVLLFILQIVLEGWGLSHYRNLAAYCQNSQLAAIFQGFLQQESRHHATGVTLFEKISLSPVNQQTIIETLTLFLQMVQVGPQSVVAAMEKVKGHLSQPQKIKIFQQLDSQTHSSTRLQTLRSLIHNPNTNIFIQELEARGAFQPLPPEKCVLN
ncbi:MAG: ferritin-like domain-containing protein [Nostocaceae cyanobacterium]|nr:ferritin-like domain-containing protein [Nostocaceae cyanobacterium]